MEAPRLTIARAKLLRRAMTPPELKLWISLRARPAGLKFRRQHPIGPFILDFYCAEGRFAVEVDGEAHGFGDNPQRDEQRDRWLAREGVRVMRVSAEDVRSEVDGVPEGVVAFAHRAQSEMSALLAVPPGRPSAP